MSNEIENSKKIFNKFFKDDLYGRFNDDKNIILSRGVWNDNYVSFPKLFKSCIDYTLEKHWTGYSDSLGHKNTLKALLKLVNTQPISKKYKLSNMALTIGNVVTIGFVFRQLKNIFPNSSVITIKPYYPPVIKSINYYFQKIIFLSALQSEKSLIDKIKMITTSNNTKILFLNNSIGVEGRIFSDIFWQEIVKIIQKRKIYLVIDEGMWFEQLKYCSEINNNYVIRIVSLSKKYGLSGCKLGYMLANEDFISEFYDCASTNYGGPLSVFFLLSEFIYQFEFIYYSNIELGNGLRPLHDQYDISIRSLKILYYDFVNTLNKNKEKFNINKQILINWIEKNSILVEKFYDFGGINVFIKPKTKLKSYDIFKKLIINEKVSIMPSSCFGDEYDSMFRITLLEKPHDLKIGLNKFKKIIQTFYKE